MKLINAATAGATRTTIWMAGYALALAGCQDKQAETLATTRCESLLAAQEISSLPEALRSDARAAISPKGDARISDGERVTFVRRAYDRLAPAKTGPRIEPRDYTCKFDKAASKVIELATNGHTQEIRDTDDEWSIRQHSTKLKLAR